MTSQRQKNKGYPIPDPPTTSDTICVTLQIPNDPQHIANFEGHLSLLTKWNWHEKTYVEGDVRARDVARMWYELIRRTLCMSDCQESSLANELSILGSSSTYITNLNNSYDGTVQSIAPNLEYNPDGLNGNRDLALCYAIQGLVDELCTLTIEYLDDYTSLTNAVSVALAMVAGILAVPSLGLSLWVIIGVGAAGLGLNIFSSLTLLGQDVYEDAEARKQVACHIYEELKGHDLTDTSFSTSINTSELTGNAVAIAEMMEVFMDDLNVYLPFTMLVNQAFGLSRVGAVLPCPCDCQYTFDFNEEPDMIWELLDGTRTTEAGRSGYGIKGEAYTASGPQYGVKASVKLWVECTVYSVRLDLKYKHGTANTLVGLSVKAYDASDVLINSQPAAGTVSRSKNTWHTVDIPIVAPDCAHLVIDLAFQNTIPNETDDKYVYLDNVIINP